MVFNTVVPREAARSCLFLIETKLTPFCIDFMRAIYLLRRLFDSPAAQERGFSNCTGGKEELELRMRNALHLPETSRATTKSNKLVDSTSLGRQPVVPTKCAPPVSPSPVCLWPGPFSEGSDDLPWNVFRAARFLGVTTQTVYLWVERRQIPHFRVMGRNLRFLRDDMECFRATFRREPERAEASQKMILSHVRLSGPRPPHSFPSSGTEMRSAFAQGTRILAWEHAGA